MNYRVCTIGIAFIIIAGILSSCVKDNEDVIDYDVVLAFNPAIYTPVKGAIGGNYPYSVPFGVTASTLPQGDKWESDWAKGESFLYNEKVEPEGDMWLPVSNCLWPHVSKNLTCIAYSPYGAASECNFTTGVAFNNVDTKNLQDNLLYTDPVEDANKGAYGGVIALPFKHALGEIGIKIKNLVDTTDKIVVNRVTLLKIRNKGNFTSLPAPVWELEDDCELLEFFKGEYESVQSPCALGNEFLIIPQTLDTQFEVNFTYYTSAGTFINQTVRSRTVGTLIEPGRNYTYTLSVGIDEVKFMLEVIDNYLQ